MTETDTIPIIETYRGVGIHDCQPRERITNIVEPAIDFVFALTDFEELVVYAADPANAPEARLFALAKCEAHFQIATEERRKRAGDRLQWVRAATAGLPTQTWRDPNLYCSMLDHGRNANAVRREVPLEK